MRRLGTRGICVALLVALGLVGSPGWPAPQDRPDEPGDPREIGLEERAGVRLGQIDVTVIGPADVVTQLTAEDFRVKIQGTIVEEFTVDRLCSPTSPSGTESATTTPDAPDTPAAPSAVASYLFYFDQPHLTMAGRQRSIDVARKLVSELVSGDARGMIVSNAARTTIVQPLTTDTELLRTRLGDLENDREQWDMYAENEDARISDVMRILNEAVFNDVTGAISRARLYQKQEYWTTNRNFRRLSVTLGQLVDLPAPKVLIYFADVARSNPGEHYLTFFGSKLVGEQHVMDAMASDGLAGGLAFDRVLNEAAAQGIRIYTIEARGLTAPADRTRTSSVSMAATSAVPSSSRIRVGDTHRTLQGMSAESGGYAFLNGVRAGKIAERVRQDSGCIYLLSFDPSGFATDSPLRLVVTTSRPGVKLRTRGRLVLQSVSSRRTSEILRAFSTPDSIPDPFAIGAGLIPTGFAKGQYSALLQVSAPGLPLQGTTWDLGASLVTGQKVRESASGRVSAARPDIPVILEQQVTFKPGVHELVAVAHEERSGMVASANVTVDWPQLADGGTMVGPIALLQPAHGAFVRQGETRGSGSLLVGPEHPLFRTRPAAFVSLVCRDKRTESVTVARGLVGESAHDFPDLELGTDDGRCVQIRDVVPSNSLRHGYYRYLVSVRASDKTQDEAYRDFAVEIGAPEGPD